MVTTLPWAWASVPSRSSSSARWPSYSPSSRLRCRLSSNGTTRRACSFLSCLPSPAAPGPRMPVKDLASLRTPNRRESLRPPTLAHGAGLGVMPASPWLQDRTAETIGSRADNFNVEDLPDVPKRARCIDRLQIGGAPDNLARTLPRALEQHRHRASDRS